MSQTALAPGPNTARRSRWPGSHRQKLPNLVLTHFSSRYQSAPGGTPHINQLAAEALQHYKGQLFLARDFDTYRLEKDFQLHKGDHS